MAKSRKRQRRKATDAPVLSRVEWEGVLVFLDWRISQCRRQYEFWKNAAKVNRNVQTVASREQHRSVLTALQAMHAEAFNIINQRDARKAFPPPVRTHLEVIERN